MYCNFRLDVKFGRKRLNILKIRMKLRPTRNWLLMFLRVRRRIDCYDYFSVFNDLTVHWHAINNKILFTELIH